MKKMVVFNVGGALCSYLEIGEEKILVDIGKSKSFNPVMDFLIPLYKKRMVEKGEDNKYQISQLIVSHPHKDHISAICDFDENFAPNFLTCPNDKDENPEDEKLDLSKFDIESSEVQCLKNMYKERHLPLSTVINNSSVDKQHLFYLKPGWIKNNNDLVTDGECYQNNVSLVSLFCINGHRVLFPGDMMRNGMKALLAKESFLKSELKKHYLCILVAPHHGLKSSFSVELFDVMKNNKTRCLNIVSEKEDSQDDNRDVDSRYSSANYCMGDNNLESTNGFPKCYQRKTSQGHICIDFENGSRPDIEIIKESNGLLNWFCQ